MPPVPAPSMSSPPFFLLLQAASAAIEIAAHTIHSSFDRIAQLHDMRRSTIADG
jgi:hypothetical protein